MTEKLQSVLATIFVAIAMALAATNAWAKDDKAFLRGAIQDNYSEIAFGQLALRNSQNPDVKAFGQMLVDDHSANNEKARNLAQQIGLKPPSGSSLGQRASHARYAVFRGPAFDRRFAKHMIDEHTQDIREMQAEAKSGKGPLADYARETIPTLQKHLDAAKSLQSKVASAK